MKAVRSMIATLLGAALAVTAAAPTAAAADTVIAVPATADTYTSSSAPTSDFGTSASLGIYGTPANTAVLRFVLPAAPAGTTLTAAVLRVRTTTLSSAGSADSAAVRTATDTWAETGTTYANCPSIDSAVLGTLAGGSTPNTAYAIPLDASALAARTGSTTLAIVGTGSDSLWLASRQTATAANRPSLQLTYTDAAPADVTAPTTPTGLSATAAGGTITLGWSASTDDVGVSGYVVHRATSPGFPVSAATVLGTTTAPSFSDPGRPPGTWHYRVTATDAAGNVSPPSDSASATVQPVPPTATRLTVQATADTYTSSSSPGSDYGASASLAAYGSPTITSVLRFVLPAAPTGQRLTSATLRIRTTTLASAGSTNAVTVRTASDAWQETGTTYAKRPATDPTVLGTLAGGTAANTAYSVPLDAAALSARSGSTTLAVQGTGSDSFWFSSRQTPTAANRPALDLTYTGEASGSAAVVLAVGDIACEAPVTITATTCRHGDVADIVRSSNPDRFLALGDLQYQRATLAQFLGAGAYNDTFGPLKDITLPVLGNHEYLDGTNGYFDYFSGGTASTPPGPRPAGYYATSIGSWTFIGLNTECGAGGVPGGCAVGSPQYEWLRARLATAPTACTIVAAHRPRWSTGASHGSYPEMAALWDLMATNGVDVVLSGHNHVSEVFQPIGASGSEATPTMSATGIRAFTAGGGGSSMQNLTPTTDPLMPALVARSRSAHGPLKLTLGAGTYSWQFLTVSGMSLTGNGTTGAFSGSDGCH
jgi:Calcineurin-like phosphoesterase